MVTTHVQRFCRYLCTSTSGISSLYAAQNITATSVLVLILKQQFLVLPLLALTTSVFGTAETATAMPDMSA